MMRDRGGWCAKPWAELSLKASVLNLEGLWDGSREFGTFEVKTFDLWSVSLSLHLIPACFPSFLYAFMHQKI